MKKPIVLFLAVILFLILVAQAGVEEELNYADIWGVMDQDEKNLFLFGVTCGCFMGIILIIEYSAEDIRTPDYVEEYIADITEYLLFYGEEDNIDAIIGSINGFYSDPKNGQINPACLAFLSYLQLRGQDISKELDRLRYYAEVGIESLFKK